MIYLIPQIFGTRQDRYTTGRTFRTLVQILQPDQGMGFQFPHAADKIVFEILQSLVKLVPLPEQFVLSNRIFQSGKFDTASPDYISGSSLHSTRQNTKLRADQRRKRAVQRRRPLNSKQERSHVTIIRQ